MRSLFVIVIAFAIVRSASAELPKVDAQVELLRVAHIQWLHDIRFRSTYRFKKGFCSTQQNAQEGRLELPWLWEDKKPEVGDGIFAKSPDFIRVTCRYSDPPLQLPNGNLTRVPFDETRSSSRNFNYHISSQFQKSAILSTQAMDESGLGSRYTAGVGSQDRISPLALWGGPPNDQFFASPEGADSTWEYTEPDSRRAQIRLTAKSQIRSEVRTLVFRRDLSCLVLESIESVVNRPGKSVPLVRAGYATNFVECKGGPVPRTVTQVLGGVSSPLNWIATVWHSDDLSTPDSFDSDFIVDLEANTRMTGLSSKLVQPVATQVNLAKLDENVFSTKETGKVPVQPLPDVGRKWPRVLLFWGNLALLLVAVVFLIRRKRN